MRKAEDSVSADHMAWMEGGVDDDHMTGMVMI